MRATDNDQFACRASEHYSSDFNRSEGDRVICRLLSVHHTLSATVEDESVSFIADSYSNNTGSATTVIDARASNYGKLWSNCMNDSPSDQGSIRNTQSISRTSLYISLQQADITGAVSTGNVSVRCQLQSTRLAVLQ